ncbi:hypothetical protein Tco_0676688 [Tanacetum coccineum]
MKQSLTTYPSHPKSDVRNITGKNKQTPKDSVRTTSVKEKLEEVKARLDFGDARKKSTRAQESAYSESRTISPRRQRRSRSPRHKERRESTVFKRLGSRGRSTSAHSDWAHRTMIKSSNGDTPFSLTYGTEAVIPAEFRMPTFRTAEVDVAENDEALEINLELLEEKREQAAIREAKSKRQMEKYYNTKVRNASFKPGDLVYRSNEASRAEDTGKLGPKWEGPYEVTEALGKGSYKLKDRHGRELPRTWNVCNLKKCYINKV